MPFPLFFVLATALGARESFLNKRRKGEMLDAEAERQDEINNIDVGINSMGVGNQFDARQIEAMNKQFQTAQGMLRSQDPKLKALGANMIADLDTAVRGNIQQNETEARADLVRQQDQEIVAAGLGQAANERRFTRTLAMNKQLNDELKSYNVAKVSYDKVINLLDNNDQLASLSGLTAFVQSIDNSVVREGELLKYQGANGLITQLVNIINKTSGRDFDPVTKQSIRNASAAILNAEKARATAITNSYQDRAIGFSLDPGKVLSGVDQTLFTPIQIDRAAQEAAEAEADLVEQSFAADQGQFAEQTGEVFGFDIPGTDSRLTVNPGANIADRLIKPFLSMTAAVGASLRGAKLLQKNDGTLWYLEQDGTMNRVTNKDFTDLQKQSDIAQLTPEMQQRLENARNTPLGGISNPIEGRQ